MEVRTKHDMSEKIPTLADIKTGTVFRFLSFDTTERPHATLYMKVQPAAEDKHHTAGTLRARCVSLIQGALSWKEMDRKVAVVKGYFQEVE